ncbi:alpha/beta-hydrolase [Tothia fuscella]|uniref:Alpha/beta-hydrolase n=1 Tax=Tothia fuscella TaxID=1048955 RepID=A0A9P4NG18_9PEZI|nr:alpha/beta-hydrolase [Tothia fuscella]
MLLTSLLWALAAFGNVVEVSAQSATNCPIANIAVTHTGSPVGEMKIVNGIQHYITYPPDNKTPDTGVLFLTDVYGLPMNHSRLLADSIARMGYLVVAPDYFNGTWMDINVPYNPGAVLVNNPPDKVDPILGKTIQYMRETLGVKKVGGAGYCYGGRYVARFLAKETDVMFMPQQRRRAEDIFGTLKVPYQFTLYSGVAHGFALRANVSEKIGKYGKEEAFLQAIRWFDVWLKNKM